MSEFFSNLSGFNYKYTKTDAVKLTDEKDETDYSDVDFCQGSIEAEEYEKDFDVDIPENKIKDFESEIDINTDDGTEPDYDSELNFLEDNDDTNFYTED